MMDNISLQTNPNYMNIPNNNKNTFHDPYAIYDDDSSATHYFLVPAIKDPQKFVTKFQELNRLGNKPNVCRVSNNNTTSCNTSGYINDRHLRRSQSQRTRTRSCGGLGNRDTRTTQPLRPVQSINKQCPLKITQPPPSRKDDQEDDYCLIKADCKSDFKPSRVCTLSSANTRLKKDCIKREHLPEFSPILQKDGFESEKENCCKLKEQRKNGKDVDRYIEMCTCIYCVRSVSYNCTGDDDGSFVEPCSCQGSTKSVIGRYVCMGLMAVFLPCMLCYFPAKCCRSRKSNKHKHISKDDTFVHYKTNNNKETL